MATSGAIMAAARSVEALLRRRFDADGRGELDSVPTAFTMRAEDFEAANQRNTVRRPGVSILVYRVAVNPTTRAGWSAVASLDGRSHLPLDVHFLLTPWAANAYHELLVLGRAMSYLDDQPILTGPLLDPTAGWAPVDAIQVVVEEMSLDSQMRIFDSMADNLRLSVPYIARIIRIDSTLARGEPAVGTVVAGVKPSMVDA